MGIIADTLTFRSTSAGPLPLTSAKVLEWLGGGATASGVTVSAQNALSISAVYDCVRIIAEDVASLPLITYRRLSTGGKARATDHPAYAVLHDSPNPYMTAMQFRETLQAHVLVRGNAYANIERDADGRLVALWPLNPDAMSAPVLSAAGTLLYTYRLPSGEPRALRQDEVLHLRGLASDGLVGYSPVALHRETFGHARALLDSGSRFFANDARPGGILQAKTKLTQEAAERLRQSWRAAHEGLTNSNRVAVLEEGLEWKQIGISPDESQWLESRKLSRTEIAGIFRMPPHMIAELTDATYSNIEEQSISYVTNTLQAWLVRWEQQVLKDLFVGPERRTYFAEHLLDAKMRGKYLERQQGLQVQRQNGVINADEWNAIENRNPLPDGKGEGYWMPVNMVEAGTVPAVPAAAPRSTVRREIRRTADGYELLEHSGGADGEQ